MKDVLYSAFCALMKFFSLIISPSTSRFLITKRKILRSLWLKNFIGKCGKKVFFGDDIIMINHHNMIIGDNVVIDDSCMITPIEDGVIDIKSNCHIGRFCHITALKRITLGENCLLGQHVTITDNSHGDITFEAMSTPPNQRPITSRGGITIGKNVWIGENAVILQDITFGDGCIIGAGSIVTKDIPAYSVAVGNPARVIKQLENK